MCGICGIFDMKNEHRSGRSIIGKMAGKLGHRGPDAADFIVRDNIALGFTRLSIVDLAGGMQPLENEDNSIILVCNGEIFNYRELREKMLQKGHRFRTNTDVEVILHLYEEYHTDFINELNGQFAFAIYDMNRRTLFCARDHVGIAPFFYTIADDTFIFASEIKAILEHPAVKREVDLVGLDQIFTFPGMVNPRTLFKNIKSLDSGNFLLVRNTGELIVKEYWDLNYPKSGELDYLEDENYYIEKLDEILTKAVKLRLQADVPVGFYISGGLDSSIIAAKIKQLYPKLQRHSFSIDFTDRDISEAKYQRLMAEYVDSIHHERLFEPKDVAERLRQVIYHSESALKETYNTASMVLSEAVRQENVKVVLTGEGADEIFAGYVGYRFHKFREQQPRSSSPESTFEEELRNRLWGDEKFIYEKDHYAYRKSKQQLYSDNINTCFSEVDCLQYPVINKDKLYQRDAVHKRSYIDFKLRLSEHLLADHGDRMAFANSVEARYPFLDKDLIEFAATIPPNLKLKGFEEKYILKRLAQDLIPADIIKRPKFTFVAPGSPELLKQDIEYIGDILSSEVIKQQGYFNPVMVENLKKQYTQKGFKLNLPFENDLLITVITFGIFLQEFNMPRLN